MIDTTPQQEPVKDWANCPKCGWHYKQSKLDACPMCRYEWRKGTFYQQPPYEAPGLG